MGALSLDGLSGLSRRAVFSVLREKSDFSRSQKSGLNLAPVPSHLCVGGQDR